MEHQIILNFLNETSDTKFETRNWNIVNDQSNANHRVGNEIIYGREVLKSNICDCNYAYILVRYEITIVGRNLATEVAFKNYTLFIKCITKIDGTNIHNAEDLELVMLMYNLFQYS